MITDDKKWHYRALKSEHIFHIEKWCNCPVTSLCRLHKGITSNHHGDFYCLNCLNCSCSTENKLKVREELYNKHDYCYPIMPKKFDNILEYKHGEKSLKPPFVIALDIECILKREHSCQSKFERSYRERKAMDEPSGWAMFTKCSFDAQKIGSIITEEQIVLKSCVKN